MTDIPNPTPAQADAAARFIARLDKLNPSKTPGAKRQHLAELRKSLSFDLGTHVPAFPYVEPFLAGLDERTGYWRRAMFYLVAGLYASHPESAQNKFGKAAAILTKKRESESLEKRFLALLAAEQEDQLVYHLRQLVSLLKAEGVGMDYASLLRDLLNWNHIDRFIQRRWAQQFYGYTPETSEADDQKGQS